MARAGLRAEIGLNLALLTVGVTVLDVGVFYVVTRQVLVDAATDLAEQSAEVIAGQLAVAPASDWRRVVDLHRRTGLAAITVYAPSGQVLHGHDSPATSAVRAAVVTREIQTEATEGLPRVVAPVGVPGRPVAAVAVSVAPRVVSNPTWTVIAAHAVLAAALVAWMGLYLLRGKVIRPLEEMQRAARRIAGGDLDARVDEDLAEELAELAGALNRMTAALAESRDRTADQLARLERANAELRAAQEALIRSEKLASVGLLAAGLAHELGNPLTAVRGYVEILRGGVDSELGAELVRRAQVEVERMHGLLRNLLDFARDEPAQAVEVDLPQLMQDALATVRHQPAFRGVALEVEAVGEPRVRADPARIHQVLVNLLLNAAQAGARRVRLRAGAGPPVTLAVEDDGEGIAPEHLPRIFEPFWTTRSPGRGTGLGLAIAQRIVEQSGGRIEVSSAPGRGSTFVLKWETVRPAVD